MNNDELKKEIKSHLLRNYGLGWTDGLPINLSLTVNELISIVGCYALEHCHLRCAEGKQSYYELDQEQRQFLEDLFNEWFEPNNPQ